MLWSKQLLYHHITLYPVDVDGYLYACMVMIVEMVKVGSSISKARYLEDKRLSYYIL